MSSPSSSTQIQVASKPKAPRNRTIDLTSHERARFAERCLTLRKPAAVEDILDRTICQDVFAVLPLLPSHFVDLAFIDPPYNLDKTFNETSVRKTSDTQYMHWVESWLSRIPRLLKGTASVYICCDWRSTPVVQVVASKYFKVRNRITWEREKGRGAKRNWKTCSEDILFCTVSNDFLFNLDAVKLRRRVIAPYTRPNGEPKDWLRTGTGNFRLTHPSNLWTDLTVPFWSMPENTDHPTQKPEKLLAKIVFASSNPGNIVFDPFLGSGTTSAVAKKLGRHFLGVEIDETFCCLSEKRLHLAMEDKAIQGYHDGVFWERNTLIEQNGSSRRAARIARMDRVRKHSVPRVIQT